MGDGKGRGRERESEHARMCVLIGRPLDHLVQDFPFTPEEMEPVTIHI